MDCFHRHRALSLEVCLDFNSRIENCIFNDIFSKYKLY